MNRERVSAELERQVDLWKQGKAKRPTVRSVADACGLSRQGIYRSHVHVTQKIRHLSKPDADVDASALKVELLRDRLALEKEKAAMLATLCGELAAALHDARDDLAHAQAAIARYQRK